VLTRHDAQGAEKRSANPPLIVFSDDWGRHPSSCQHLVSQLLPRRDVIWVNTIGTRRPRLDRLTLLRGLEKLGHWVGRRSLAETIPSGLQVVSPWMWPSFGSSWERSLNRSLLLRQLAPLAASLPQLPIGVTTVPVIADLVGTLPVARWVYYCVDDLSEWPGLDRRTIHSMESDLIRRADLLVAVSESLQRRLAEHDRESHLLTHGLDLLHWSSPSHESVPELDSLEAPLVVFWGSIDKRLDVSFLDQLGRDLERGTIVLIGPWSDPPRAVGRVPRLVSLKPLSYRRLPAVANRADVLVMPYADLPVTQAMQPLKLKEYLATGKPVVVRDLPATREWVDCLDLVDSPESFSVAVRRRLYTGIDAAQQSARGRLQAEDWRYKAQRFESWLAL